MPDDFDAKADAGKLLDMLLPFAQQMLQKHREFFPFGGYMAPDGTLTQAGAWNGSEHPPSQELIQLLKGAYQAKARQGEIRACAIVYDIRTIPPGRTEKQDAIAVSVDHISGYSAVIIFPYVLGAAGEPKIEPPYAVRGSQGIFAPS